MAMPPLEVFLAFTVARLTLLLIPGPAVMYITALGLREGRRTATAAAVGLGVGNFAHVVAATLGLSALLVSSALAFSMVKYVGAAYLIYLGIQTLRRRADLQASVTVARTNARREFRRGIIVNVFNPKVAIFFLAFVPQFIEPERGAVAGQVLLLGAWFVVLGIITDALYGATAGELGDWLRNRPGVQVAIQRASGCIYIILGVVAALASTDRSEAAARITSK
jgi:threonine/homoserine/homoserine lactone efflux protein